MIKRRIWLIAALLFFLLQLAVEAMTCVAISRLNMLPDRYAWLLYCGLVFLAIAVGFFGFFHLPGKKVGCVRRAIACVLSLLIAVGCMYGWHAAQKVYSTMEKITTTEPTVPSRGVFVRSDDPAQTLEDTASYRYGLTILQDSVAVENVRISIEERLQQTLQVQEFDGAAEMVDALLDGDVDAVILNSGYLSILEDEEAYKDIYTQLRLVEQIPLVERQPEPEQTEPVSTQPPTEPVPVDNITTNPFVIYFSGLDMRGESLGVSRSDVNILAAVNPVTKQILLLNTPRDYYVLHPYSQHGTKDKLTHCGIYGIECSVQALEMLYDIDVNYYAQVNFSGFETLIDEIGGVTVCSDRAFSFYSDTGEQFYFQKGENHLNGAGALTFARDRYHQSGGDNDRGKNQMKVIQAVVSKVTSGATIISNYSGVLDSMSGMFTTSLSMDDISLLVKMQLSDMASWNIQSYAVIGTGGRATTYSMPDFEAYVCYPNEDSVAFGTELINRVLSGEILTEEDVKFS